MKPPKILQLGEMRKINDYLCTKSGCFAFLLPDAQWIYSDPKSGKEAFEKWSIELYTVYHDYGCEYLKYILSGKGILAIDLRDDLCEARKHLHSVNRIFRNNLAHGVLDVSSRNNMRDEISRYCTKKSKGEKWNVYFNEFSDDDWISVANRLKQDADNLLETLRKWADVAEKESGTLSPRENFGNACEFKKSISKRIVYDSLDKEFTNKNMPSATAILDGRANMYPAKSNSEWQLEKWQNDIQKEFLERKIETADDIVLKLKKYLYMVHNPPEDSSIDIARRNGFSLDDF